MTIKSLSLASAACLIGAPLAALDYSNDSGGSVTFYGQLSPAYLSFNDGDETDNNLVDNTRSNSRVGFNLDQEFGNGQNLRFRFETALGAPGSDSFSQEVEPIWEWEKTDIRHVDLIWSGGFGQISLGQGSMSSDGIAGSDLSGTTMASNVTIADVGGSYFFRQKDGALSDVQLGDVYKDFDGGRRGRIRYDTPRWHGLSLTAAYGTDVLSNVGDKLYYDVALFYQDTLDAFEFAAALGYAWVREDGDTEGSWAGSFSSLHTPTGLNLTIAAGGSDEDESYAYGKLGWRAAFWDGGKTSFSVDYYQGDDFNDRSERGTDSSQWGVQVQQLFDALSLEAYLAYSSYSFDDKGSPVSYQDGSSVLAGLRWRF